MNKKGFTLIELLAVIVILAIIALIAVPIVLGIIEDSRKSATLRSAEHYIDGVEQAVARAMLNGNTTIDANGTYSINSDGDICIGTDCIEVEVDGEKPKAGGTITLSSGSITSATFELNSKPIVLANGKLDYADNSGGGNDVEESLIGKAVSFNPGDQVRNWHIIGETATTVDLLLDENLGSPTEWIKQSDYNNDDTWNDGNNKKGPITALKTLNTLTADWTNVDPIIDYSYINNSDTSQYDYGYQKLEINNAGITITNYDSTTTTIEGNVVARIPSFEELFLAASYINPNLTEKNLSIFVEENLSTINSIISGSATNVDEAIQIIKNTEFNANSRYGNLVLLVMASLHYGGDNIEPYDLTMPSWLYLHLDKDYWTITTPISDGQVYTIDLDAKFSSAVVDNQVGIRPVITVDKTDITIVE